MNLHTTEKTALIGCDISYFPDDLTTLCEECGQRIFVRPYWKEKIDSGQLKVLCLPCAVRYMKEEAEEPVVPPETRAELKSLGFTDDLVDEVMKRFLEDLKNQTGDESGKESKK